MDRPKRWYDPDASTALRLIPRAEYEESWSVAKWRHPRVSPGLGECLLYPLSDGPGLGLLFFLPPILWVLSLPVFRRHLGPPADDQGRLGNSGS